MILSIFPAGYIGYTFIQKYRDFSALWLGTALLFLGVWVSTQGVGQLLHNVELQQVFLYSARTLGAIIAICILFFTIEYSTGQVITKRLFAFFTLPAAIIHSSIVLDPTRFMSVVIEGRSIVYNFGIFGKAHILFVTVLYSISLSFLFREFIVTEGKLHKQARILFGGLIVAVLFSFVPLLNILPPLPISPMVVGLIISSGIFSYGLKKYDLYTTTPIQVTTLMNNLETGIIVLNNSNEVIRINDSALVFTDTDDIVGQSIETVSQNETLVEFVFNSEDMAVLTNEDTTQTRYYKLSSQSLDYGRGVSGQVLLIQDTTTVESQKQQLDLLRQIFSRLLRHNIRNKLTVINGFIESLQKETTTQKQKNNLQTMKSASDSLLQSSNKAHLLSNATTEDIYSQEVHTVVGQGISSIKNKIDDPSVQITTDLQEPTTEINISPSSHYIISNIIENSIEHVESPVNISILGNNSSDQKYYHVRVEDNGYGIPQEEIDVVNSKQESSLEHGTGIGLWVIKLLVNHIGGTVSFVSSNSGTSIKISFRKTEDDS